MAEWSSRPDLLLNKQPLLPDGKADQHAVLLSMSIEKAATPLARGDSLFRSSEIGLGNAHLLRDDCQCILIRETTSLQFIHAFLVKIVAQAMDACRPAQFVVAGV